MAEQPAFVTGWMPDWMIEIFRAFCWLVLHLLARVEVRGQENVPVSGGVIVATNHMTYFDAPLIFTLMRHRRPTVLSADKYRTHAFFKPILEAVDCLWVNRDAPAASTIKAAVRQLRAGAILGMAPEGTRSRGAQLLPGKTGVAYLATAAGVPVIPVAIAGNEQIIPHLKRLRRARVVATIGQPVIFPPSAPGARPTPQQLEEYTTELMCQLAAQLPPEYHGAYAGHPRVRELQAADGPA